MKRSHLGMAIGGAAVAAGLVARSQRRRRREDPNQVNDVHSRLNATEVADVVRPKTFGDLIGAVERLARANAPLSVSGSRHAMGGQQFASGQTLLDLRGLDRILDFDDERGVVHVEAGIEWPQLLDGLHRRQRHHGAPWTIPTKQTGADRLTVGGALAANAHGRTLTRAPMGDDVESILLVDPSGRPLRCSREENADLFRLAIGGYGLFGPIYSAQLRLVPRTKVQRVVSLLRREEVMPTFADRIAQGYTLGDWQFAIDEASPDFLAYGVFSCYRPLPNDTAIHAHQRKIPRRAYNELVYLAHADKSRAFRLYSDFYLSTSGQVYWSDSCQLAGYVDGYHGPLDRRLGASCPGSEMITELYVPRDRFADFMTAAAETILERGESVIYGTVRLIERDTTSFLPWAREPYACVIFNLHVDHEPTRIEAAKVTFRALTDLALDRGGTFYLTYHRWATREQVERAYPDFSEFLRLKREYDPQERFTSDWYRHYRHLFGMD